MEDNPEAKRFLEERHAELVRVIEALESLEKSEEWATLKELVYDRSLTSIERQLLNESLTTIIDVNKLYKLQGERAWAKQYADTNRFVESLKKQLENINKQIK